MASIVAPRPIGAAGTAFTQSLLGAMQMRRQADAAEQLARLRELQIAGAQREGTAADQLAQLRALQITGAQREEDERRQFASVVPQIMAAQPQAMEIAPAQPGTPPTPSPLGFEVGAMEPGRPGQPAVTQSMLTMGGLAQQVGPQALASVAMRPEGRALLAMRGVITDEEAERRRKKASAIEAFGRDLTESSQAFETLDLEGGLLKQARAYRTLAPHSDNPADMLARADDVTKQFLRYKREQTEHVETANEFKRMVTALRNLQESPSIANDAAFMDALASAKTPVSQQRAMEFWKQYAEGRADHLKSLPIRQLNQRIGQIVMEHTAKGKPLSPQLLQEAARQAVGENAPATAALLDLMIREKNFPAFWAEIFTERKAVSKNEIEFAEQGAKARGFVPGTPQFTAEAMKILRDLHAKDKDDLGGLRTQQNTLAMRERTLASEVTRAQTAGDKQGEAEARMELKDVRDQLEGIQQDLERKGAVPRPAKRAPALIAADEPPSAKKIKPNTPEYEERAMAEALKLIGAGHTNESAVAAMRKAGWDVK